MSKVKETRQALGLSQTTVAEKIGTSTMILSTIENDKTLPVPSDMNKLCSLFGKTVGELYTRAETSFGRRDYRTGNTNIVNLSVRVSRDFKNQFINDEILQSLGYESFKDWLMDMARESRQRYNKQEGIMVTTMWYKVEVKVEIFDEYSNKAPNRDITTIEDVEFEVFDDSMHNNEIAKISAKKQAVQRLKEKGYIVAHVKSVCVKNCGVNEDVRKVAL